MGKIKKKGTTGQCAAFITQKQAMRKLQLSLPNFRRICVLKGIYPTDPPNRKKVGKGNSEHRVYYFSKDIAFLAREPLIETFRNLRIHQLKLKKAKNRDDKEKFFKVRLNKPRYSLHALVKERYPSREDAVRDLTNSLNLLFVFSHLPRLIQFNPALIQLSRRLCIEFLNYLITARAIRKAFITIKGFYIEAEILGIPVVWVMPHVTSAHAPTDVDFQIMATCLEFDATLLGSLLTHLYNKIGLAYPPKTAIRVDVDSSNQYCTSSQVHFEFLSSLTFPLKRQTTDSQLCNDDELQELQAIDEQVTVCVNKEVEKQKQMKLFEGKKFFLNREIPREVVCLIIHACGGICSYDSSLCVGSTFGEDDDSIDYQIVDRPMNNMRASRYYVQPQWVFDSLNAKRLLPPQDYLPGTSLPPHLSPFIGRGAEAADSEAKANLLQHGGLTGTAPGMGAGASEYRPPEADYLAGLVTLAEIRGRQLKSHVSGDSEDEEDEDMSGAAKPRKTDSGELIQDPGMDSEESNDSSEESEVAENQDEDDSDVNEIEEEKPSEKGKKRSAPISKDVLDPKKAAKQRKQMPNDSKAFEKSKKKPVIVRPGKAQSSVRKANLEREEANTERKMREMLMTKKHKRVYNKMSHAVKRRDKEIRDLTARRAAHDSAKAR